MNQKNLLLSAIVITKNEAARLSTCLKALQFCDEIIVVDNGSSDDTVRIAQKHNAVIIPMAQGDFAQLRNGAKERAQGRWLLYVDADEVVTPLLAQEITHIVHAWKDGQPDIYALKRKNYYLGREWPTDEWMKRLFRAPALIEWKGALHETPVTLGPVAHLSALLLHDTHRSLDQMVEKTNIWSETEAKLRFDAHHPPIMGWRLIRVMVSGFWNSFVTQKGYKAGVVGWIESIYQAFSMFITYAKLWELQQKKR